MCRKFDTGAADLVRAAVDTYLQDLAVYLATLVTEASLEKQCGYCHGYILDSPSPGCVHHSDRGSQYAAYRDELAARDLKGLMGRRGNRYDNAKAESFIKTLKVEAVYPMFFEMFEDVAEHLPRFIDNIYNS